MPLVQYVEAPTTLIWWTLLKYYLFLGFSAGTVVTVWMLYNIVKYRERKSIKDAPKYHHEDESGWGNWKTVVLTLLVTGSVLAFVEYQTFASTGLIVPPNTTGDPIYINVTGQQFLWTFQYSNGAVNGTLTVPVNTVVILNITSIDVDHSFSIDSLDVAKDALPGVHNFLWFNATQTGFYKDDIRCKELCGVGHADMIADLNVTTEAGYQQYLAAIAPSTSTATTSVSTAPTTVTVVMPQGVGSDQSLNFQPSSIHVTIGVNNTITFKDQDNTAPHNVWFTSIPSGATNPNSAAGQSSFYQLTNGDSVTYTLTTPGTYKFECQFHSGWMQGTITVTG